MELNEALYTTRSMRRLSEDPVPEEALRRIFDAAVRGPSGGNEQRFRFLTVTDGAIKTQVRDIYLRCLQALHEPDGRYSHVADAVKGDPTDPGVSQLVRINKSAMDLAENLHKAPLLLFVFGKQAGESSTFPVLWNLCLAARAEGLGTTITTLLKAEKRTVEQLLGVPDDDVWHMHAMVPVGFPTGRWGVPKRKPAHESVFAERWGNPVPWTVDQPLWEQPT